MLGRRRYFTAGDVSESVCGARSATAHKVYTTVYELAGSEAVQARAFQLMRGWYQFAPHIDSRTQAVASL